VTVLTLRRIRQDRFEVTGLDIEPMTFKTRVEARGVADPGSRQKWCAG
jgi:hypothetical protein